GQFAHWFRQQDHHRTNERKMDRRIFRAERQEPQRARPDKSILLTAGRSSTARLGPEANPSPTTVDSNRHGQRNEISRRRYRREPLAAGHREKDQSRRSKARHRPALGRGGLS